MTAKFIRLTEASIDWDKLTAEPMGQIYCNVDHIVTLASDHGEPAIPATGLFLTSDPVPAPEGWYGSFVMETPEQILALIEGAPE